MMSSWMISWVELIQDSPAYLELNEKHRRKLKQLEKEDHRHEGESVGKSVNALLSYAFECGHERKKGCHDGLSHVRVGESSLIGGQCG